MSRGLIGLLAKTLLSIAPSSTRAASHLCLSSADFITIIAEFNFRYTQEFSPLRLAALAQYNGDERCNRDSGRDNDLAGRRWSIPHRAPADHASSRAVSPGE
jgi:hypothetical protein